MVTAREGGTCPVCTDAYHAGDELGLVVEGWAHISCWGWTTTQEVPC